MMEIGPLSNSQAGQVPERPERQKPATPPQKSSGRIVDRVEISNDSRAKLGELADQELRKQRSRGVRPAGSEASDSNDRIETIRRRVESGYYGRAEVKARIADRLIDDGDI